MLDGELLQFNIRPQETLNCLSIADSGGRPWHTASGSHREVTCRQREAGRRAHAFVRVFGLASKAEARLVNSNQKRKVLAMLHSGVVFKGPREGTGGRGDLITRGFEKSYAFILLLEFKATAGCLAK